MKNPFEQFNGKETKHKIEALGGAEVTLRELSLADNAEIEALLYKEGFNDDGKPIMSITNINKAKLMRVSKALVVPVMTMEHLETLSLHSLNAINEIADIVNPRVDEGN